MPMRVQTIVTYICSLCAAETDVPGKMTAYQITGPGKPLNFDICTDCAEVGPFRDVLERGQRDRSSPSKPAKAPVVPEVAPSDDGGFACPDCGHVLGSRSGLSSHRARKHDVLSQMPDAIAMRTRGEGPLKCPECAAAGQDYGAKAAQGLAAHRRHAHGVEGKARK